MTLSLENEQTWFREMTVPAAAAEPGCAEAVAPLAEAHEKGEKGWDLYLWDIGHSHTNHTAYYCHAPSGGDSERLTL